VSDDADDLREQVDSLRREMAAVRGFAHRAGDVRREEDPSGYRAHQWEEAAQRAVRRRYRSLAYRAKRAGIIFCVYIVAGSFVSIDPGKWFHPQVCGAEKSATVAAEPAAVKVAKDQGRLLRRLAGKPPSPEATDRFARHAADVVVVTTLAFLASARDEQEPAKVTAYNTAHARRVAAQDAAWKAGCTPPCPPNQPGQIAPGVRSVSATTGPALAADQAATAATIVRVGRSMGVPDRGLIVAVAAARQESGLRNLNHGDRDSLGVFQQRASWGTVAQRMNPEWAAAAFYRALQRVPRWQAMTVAQAAQAVQVSAYPAAYARWEALAVAVVGGQPAADCTSSAPSTYKTGAGVAWGPEGGPAYANGRIPFTALTHPAQAPTAWFRPDAAAAFDRLSAAYATRFGHPLRVTDSYRDYAHQVSTKAAKPGLAAVPGTSNHGWGLAADVQVGGYGSADYQWLLHNAPAYGWSNPGWAQAGGSKHEPWHYEYNPTGAAA
jgi:hypothetical protein